MAFIEAADLRKTYHVGKIEVPALRGVSFEIKQGEFVSVVGPSGSGKSTLFYILGGLTRADSGRLIVSGDNFAEMSDAQRTRMRKRKIGFVFQKFNLLPTLNARSNIEKAAPPAFGTFRWRTTTRGVGTRFDQQASDCLGGRADREPRFEELRNHLADAAPIESGIEPDRADDHAQSRGRRIR